MEESINHHETTVKSEDAHVEEQTTIRQKATTVRQKKAEATQVLEVEKSTELLQVHEKQGKETGVEYDKEETPVVSEEKGTEAYEDGSPEKSVTSYGDAVTNANVIAGEAVTTHEEPVAHEDGITS